MILILTVGPEIAARPWLVIAIVLYVFNLACAFTIQRSARDHAIDVTSVPPPAGAPTGPPPELAATVNTIQRDGIMLGLIIVAIVFLMVVKPGA